jgi:hypothetical protein
VKEQTIEDTITRVLVISSGRPEKDIGQPATRWDIGAHLSFAGDKTVKHRCIRIKEELPQCQIFGCSPLIKAQQTSFVVMDEMGIKKADRARHIHYMNALWSVSPEIWQMECCPSKYCNSKVYEDSPDAVTREGNTVLGGVIRLQEIAKSACLYSAIAISHRGPLDAAIMVAKRLLNQKVDIGDVHDCEGAIFHFGIFSQLIRVEDFLAE